LAEDGADIVVVDICTPIDTVTSARSRHAAAPPALNNSETAERIIPMRTTTIVEGVRAVAGEPLGDRQPDREDR
jgi:hypothetical protein